MKPYLCALLSFAPGPVPSCSVSERSEPEGTGPHALGLARSVGRPPAARAGASGQGQAWPPVHRRSLEGITRFPLASPEPQWSL